MPASPGKAKPQVRMARVVRRAGTTTDALTVRVGSARVEGKPSVIGNPSVIAVPRGLDVARRPKVSPLSCAVGLGQCLGRGLLGWLADVVVDGLADDAGGQVVEMGVELLGESEVFGPEGFLVELLWGA